MGREEFNLTPKIMESTDGHLQSYELGDLIKNEGDEIIENDPDATNILGVIKIIKSPDAKRSMIDGLINHLKKQNPEFNWSTYFDLINEVPPTVN